MTPRLSCKIQLTQLWERPSLGERLVTVTGCPVRLSTSSMNNDRRVNRWKFPEKVNKGCLLFFPYIKMQKKLLFIKKFGLMVIAGIKILKYYELMAIIKKFFSTKASNNGYAAIF
jgi:hypothetical protein